MAATAFRKAVHIKVISHCFMVWLTNSHFITIQCSVVNSQNDLIRWLAVNNTGCVKQIYHMNMVSSQKTLELVLQVLMKNLKTLRNSKIRQMVKSHQLDCFNDWIWAPCTRRPDVSYWRTRWFKITANGIYHRFIKGSKGIDFLIDVWNLYNIIFCLLRMVLSNSSSTESEPS